MSKKTTPPAGAVRGTPPPAVDSTTSRVSHRLRQLRKQRHWTLEQLAEISGVSRSMLSQIERNQANPTLAVAFRIARAFGRSLADLVDEPSTSVVTSIRAADPTYRFRSDPSCRIRTLYPMHLEKDVEFYEVWLAPGGALRSAAHFVGTREMLTVGAGKVAVESGKDRSECAAGDAAHYPADVPHAIENIGDGDALVYLVVICRAE